MKERIKKLRKEKHLTQQEFADKIGISRNNVATYEIGRNNPSEAVISLICRTFNVNETWLRTGEGEMFSQPSSQAEQVVAWVQNIFTNGTEAEKGLIAAMSTFTKEDWAMLAHLIKKIWESQQTATAPHAREPSTEPLPQEKPCWMTDDEWDNLQRNRTAKDGRSTEAG